MPVYLRIIFWIAGSLLWAFWMYLAYHSDYLGMPSSGENDDYYYFRCFFSRIPIEKTPKNKKRIFLCLILFGEVVITSLCLFT